MERRAQAWGEGVGGGGELGELEVGSEGANPWSGKGQGIG